MPLFNYLLVILFAISSANGIPKLAIGTEINTAAKQDIRMP